MIGEIVTVTVDRPLGSFHPEHKDMYYPINYGYIEGIIAPDGEGKINVTKLRPIAFEPVGNGYYVLGEKVGNAFSDGNSLK